MNEFTCIHGHFYQPPRENPWLERVQLQESAYPYHDWNQRVTAECYAPNTASRILDHDGRILKIVNNYSKMSFNFGPTLLSWLKNYSPEVYQNIIDSDRRSLESYSGHGSAIAQCYNHMIMPLATTWQKRIQVFWGIKDFMHHFCRRPDGMWLPETAVDMETLEIMAENEIKFTILGPHQAKRIRKIDSDEPNDKETWMNIETGKLDTRMPYLCCLPNGKNITIFFYDEATSKDIAFNLLLNNGEVMAKRLVERFTPKNDFPELVNIASDGETYGHHHKFGEMALSYCINFLETNEIAAVTNYSEYLTHFSPTHEVEINENTSWSCSHGVERWRNDCGCNMGSKLNVNQAWRKPLRAAMDWLWKTITSIYKTEMTVLVTACWDALEDYIEVIFDRSNKNVETFLNRHKDRELSREEKIKVLSLLESQRQGMLMFTSCGWYFDEVSGIETIQVLRHASRAIQLIQKVTDDDLEGSFLQLLEKVPSNKKEYVNAANIYNRLVKPLNLDLHDIGLYFAIASLFKSHPKFFDLFFYKIETLAIDRINSGAEILVTGRIIITSKITWDEEILNFASLRMNDDNIIWGVCDGLNEDSYNRMNNEMKDVLLNNSPSEIKNFFDVMSKSFGNNRYSFRQLTENDLVILLDLLFESSSTGFSLDMDEDMEMNSEKYYWLLELLKEWQSHNPKNLISYSELVLNSVLHKLVEQEGISMGDYNKFFKGINNLSVKLDDTAMGYLMGLRVDDLMSKLNDTPEDLDILTELVSFFSKQNKIHLIYKYWEAYNIFYRITTDKLPKILFDPKSSNPKKTKLLELYKELSQYLGTPIILEDEVH